MLSDVAELFGEAAVAPAADRRLTRRVIDAWARAARGRFPSWAQFCEMELGTDWQWLFAVDVEKSVGFPYFIFLGDSLAKLSDIYLSGQTDWTISLLDKACSDISAAVAGEGPHIREEALTLCNGRRLLFRAATMPLADDGETITHVIGAANGRVTPAHALSLQ